MSEAIANPSATPAPAAPQAPAQPAPTPAVEAKPYGPPATQADLDRIIEN